jgi:hypothetical protein
MTRTIFIAAALALAVTLPAVSALAQAPRTFVSAAGSDSNPCTFALPCRHFQNAVDVTAVGGEVDALDPAGYGPITINQAITIEGQGWSYIAPPAGGNGITINAVSGNVSIHGVSLNGVGITGGTNGIVFNSGTGLMVSNCVLQNFVANGPGTGNGILIQPTSGTVNFAITNTTISNNIGGGISYDPPSGAPSANGIIDHVNTSGNGYGILMEPSLTTGGSTIATISNTIMNSNAVDGIQVAAGPGALKLSIDNASISSNGGHGILLAAGSILLGRSVITGNATGVSNGTNTFYTYKDNRINLNGTDISGTALNTTFATQ